MALCIETRPLRGLQIGPVGGATRHRTEALESDYATEIRPARDGGRYVRSSRRREGGFGRAACARRTRAAVARRRTDAGLFHANAARRFDGQIVRLRAGYFERHSLGPLLPDREYCMPVHGLMAGQYLRMATDQNAAIHLYTHERACPEARSARGTRGVSNLREGAAATRGLVQCRRGRTSPRRA